MSAGPAASPGEIRPLSEGSDVAAVAELAGELGYPAAAADVAQRLRSLVGSPLHGLFVAASPEGIEGWIHVASSAAVIHDPEAEIVSLVVAGPARGRGVGARLLSAAEAWARSRGLRRIRVRCRVERDRAHAFYEREGFERVKTQRVYSKRLTRG